MEGIKKENVSKIIAKLRKRYEELKYCYAQEKNKNAGEKSIDKFKELETQFSNLLKEIKDLNDKLSLLN